jgi:hypothetical protein
MIIPNRLIFVIATRSSKDIFWSFSPLGLSIKRLQMMRALFPLDRQEIPTIIKYVIFYENARGIPKVYNSAIAAIADDQRTNINTCKDMGSHDPIIVFAHDDVWLDDAQIAHHLNTSLKVFDIVGVAGSVDRIPGQSSWCFTGEECSLKMHGLSGMICSGDAPFSAINYFGPSEQPCELLDGVFLAARLSTLTTTNLRFDLRFDFHFYDLDFCRSATSIGLRLGTWPISITHQSEGDYGDKWRHSYHVYLSKWGD